MEKKLNIWNDYQNQKNYDLSFKTKDDNPPDHITLKESKDDRGKNGEQWNFKIVSKNYIDTKNAEQDETIRQQQAQITEHSHKLREHDEKITQIEEKNSEQDTKISEIEEKNIEQDNLIKVLDAKNTEQDKELTNHERRLEELDGGHTTNLGKIGEIETKLDDHNGRLDLLETETENYSPRVYREHLPNIELKNENSIVKCTVDILTNINNTEQNLSVHLSGILTIDEKNNHNNILQLLSDNVFSKYIYNIELCNDDSLVINIVHSKKIEIKKVTITEFNQIFINYCKCENKKTNTENNETNTKNIFAYPPTYFRESINKGKFIETTLSTTKFYNIIDDYKEVIMVDIDALVHIQILNKEDYKGYEFSIARFLNTEMANKVVPLDLEMKWLLSHSMVIINGSDRYAEPVYLKMNEVFRGKNMFMDFMYLIPSERLKVGNNVINLKIVFTYNPKGKVIEEQHL